jgi:hypothetical protein
MLSPCPEGAGCRSTTPTSTSTPTPTATSTPSTTRGPFDTQPLSRQGLRAIGLERSERAYSIVLSPGVEA